ncbi:hypothetical protein K443DRAFT_610346 [Laccaria amethystina LaAM-08-1]|uniref:BTB domain-containing protein n=1 Tax=Laccaria amethystina LaAM-08-1 TaxID=1095629 RepID=A0A0C9XT19_9AGAR|nr:hypothetical protein K443DRAFT_610346 [Laccaria amethystina LaAM-08-1]
MVMYRQYAMDHRLAVSTKISRRGRCRPSPLRNEVKEMDESDIRVVRVQNNLFEAPLEFFSQMPPEVLEIIAFHSGKGMSSADPIVLSGHTAPQFRLLLSAFNAYPQLDFRKFSLFQLLSLSELSCHYGLQNLRSWCLGAFFTVVNCQDSPLRTASHLLVFRMMKLALTFRHRASVLSIQNQWVRRLLLHELPALPALLLAEQHGLRHLLGHAYYAYLIHVRPRLLEVCDPSFKHLSIKQKMHLREGYHSLLVYSKHLYATAPTLERAKGCKFHMQCVSAWKMWWGSAAERPCAAPDIDIISRLSHIEKILEDDSLLGVYLTSECRILALESVSKKQTEFTSNLHHHFDLA